MMNLKTLALVVFFVAFLSLIKDESCISCVAVFCEDYFIKILLFGSILSNDMLLSTYNSIFRPLSSREAPITRAASRNEFYQSIASTIVSQRRLCYAGPILWNTIDADLKKYSFHTFRKKYKSKILTNYWGLSNILFWFIWSFFVELSL